MLQLFVRTVLWNSYVASVDKVENQRIISYLLGSLCVPCVEAQFYLKRMVWAIKRLHFALSLLSDNAIGLIALILTLYFSLFHAVLIIYSW